MQAAAPSSRRRPEPRAGARPTPRRSRPGSRSPAARLRSQLKRETTPTAERPARPRQPQRVPAPRPLDEVAHGRVVAERPASHTIPHKSSDGGLSVARAVIVEHDVAELRRGAGRTSESRPSSTSRCRPGAEGEHDGVPSPRPAPARDSPTAAASHRSDGHRHRRALAQPVAQWHVDDWEVARSHHTTVASSIVPGPDTDRRGAAGERLDRVLQSLDYRSAEDVGVIRSATSARRPSTRTSAVRSDVPPGPPRQRPSRRRQPAPHSPHGRDPDRLALPAQWCPVCGAAPRSTGGPRVAIPRRDLLDLFPSTARRHRFGCFIERNTGSKPTVSTSTASRHRGASWATSSSSSTTSATSGSPAARPVTSSAASCNARRQRDHHGRDQHAARAVLGGDSGRIPPTRLSTPYSSRDGRTSSPVTTATRPRQLAVGRRVGHTSTSTTTARSRP